MKSIHFAIFSLTIIFPLVAYARPSQEVSLERYLKLREKSLALETCVQILREDLRPLVEDFGGWISDMFDRVESLIEHRRTCDSIELSNPPRPWEIIQREACEVAFQGRVLFEVVRVNYEVVNKIQIYPAIVRRSIENFVNCVNTEIPEVPEYPEPEYPEIPNGPPLHRN